MNKKDPVSIRDFETDKSHKIDDLIKFLTDAKEAGCEKVTISAGDYEDAILNIEMIASGKKKEIKINKSIKPVHVPLFNAYAQKVGVIEGEHQFHDIRIQIMEAKAEGYYVMFNGNKISIESDGSCSHWPPGFFDTSEKQLSKLVGF